jgi:hypothetical protein
VATTTNVREGESYSLAAHEWSSLVEDHEEFMGLVGKENGVVGEAFAVVAP